MFNQNLVTNALWYVGSSPLLKPNISFSASHKVPKEKKDLWGRRYRPLLKTIYLFVYKFSILSIPFKLEKLPTNNRPSTSLRHLLGLCLVHYFFSMILILFKCLTDGLRETCFLGPQKKENKTCSPKHIVTYPLYLDLILFVGTLICKGNEVIEDRNMKSTKKYERLLKCYWIRIVNQHLSESLI